MQVQTGLSNLDLSEMPVYKQHHPGKLFWHSQTVLYAQVHEDTKQQVRSEGMLGMNPAETAPGRVKTLRPGCTPL